MASIAFLGCMQERYTLVEPPTSTPSPSFRGMWSLEDISVDGDGQVIVVVDGMGQDGI
jgi:hypothetical protein